MSLSDIKFKYLDKIDNVNARMDRYEEIIKDYSKRIKLAEKEENPNISSVVKARERYEKKIENMLCVRDYYQEFVDTADYLMQNLNNHSVVQSNMKYEDLEKRNESLRQEVENLQNSNYIMSKELEKFEISDSLNKKQIKRQKEEIRELKKTTKMVKILEDENAFLKKRIDKLNESLSSSKKNSSSVKKLKKEWYSERRKLINENISLKDTNDFLERRNQQLEDYANHLLSRRTDEPLQMGIQLNPNKNIFEQIREGK